MRPTIRVHYESEEELEHHGVKGMKWGQHIFGRDRSKSIAKRKAAQKVEKKSASQKLSEKVTKAKAESAARRRQKILSNPQKLYKHRKEFTKEEIDSAMKTFEWEKKLRDLSIDSLTAGVKTASNLVNLSANGISGWNNVAKIYNAFKPKDQKPLPIIAEPQKGTSGDGGKKKK